MGLRRHVVWRVGEAVYGCGVWVPQPDRQQRHQWNNGRVVPPFGWERGHHRPRWARVRAPCSSRTTSVSYNGEGSVEALRTGHVWAVDDACFMNDLDPRGVRHAETRGAGGAADKVGGIDTVVVTHGRRRRPIKYGMGRLSTFEAPQREWGIAGRAGDMARRTRLHRGSELWGRPRAGGSGRSCAVEDRWSVPAVFRKRAGEQASTRRASPTSVEKKKVRRSLTHTSPNDAQRSTARGRGAGYETSGPTSDGPRRGAPPARHTAL